MKNKRDRLGLAARIRALRPGSDPIILGSNTERMAASQIGRTLFRSGATTFQIVTRKRKVDGKYAVIAVE